MGTLLQHPRHVLRRLLRSPLFTFLTILTVAIGIGANTAIFSVLDGVLLKPLPFPDSTRLAAVWQIAPGIGIGELNASPATYFTYREESRTFQDIGLWRRDSVSATGIAEPEEIDCLMVTDGTLPILGVQPALGRWFTRKDDTPDTPETAMLAYGYWQRRFGGDPHAIGQRILLDGKAYEVIGVMPRSFRFMNFQPAVILPFRFDRSKVFVGNFSYQAVARLKPGVTLAQANADVARMIPMLSTKFPPAPGLSAKMLEDARLGPLVRPLKDDVVGDIGKLLWVLMGTVGIVLFIACANVANLLLVRAEGRQHELAIRAALGASRWQVARELLLESVTLGLIGGALGLGLADIALRVLAAAGPRNLPRLEEIGIDFQVLLFALAISLAAGLLFGAIPVFKYAGPRVAAALRQGGRTVSEGRERHRARSVLVVVQVALALVLLISSGLMIRTLQALRHVQPGFTNPEGILSFHVSMPAAQVRDPQQVVRLSNEIVDKIQALPGVTAAAVSNSVTMEGTSDNDPVFAADRTYAEGQLPPIRRFKFIGPGTFGVMGNPLVAGRDVTWTDLYERRPVVLVSDNLARELWGTPAAALGKRVRESPKGTWREVIGVAGDEHDDGISQKAPCIVYWPLLVTNFWGDAQNVQRFPAFLIRSPRSRTSAFVQEAERAVWSLNPNLTITRVRTVEEVYERSMARTSFTLVMLTIAAGMALLLGLVGIYGVVSYSVSQRTREIGIRMALGARHQAVRQIFVGNALMLTGIGVACGLSAAFGLTRLMSALLYGVRPLDPVTYGAVSALLAGAALAASYIPARKATSIDPATALRSE